MTMRFENRRPFSFFIKPDLKQKNSSKIQPRQKNLICETYVGTNKKMQSIKNHFCAFEMCGEIEQA